MEKTYYNKKLEAEKLLDQYGGLAPGIYIDHFEFYVKDENYWELVGHKIRKIEPTCFVILKNSNKKFINNDNNLVKREKIFTLRVQIANDPKGLGKKYKRFYVAVHGFFAHEIFYKLPKELHNMSPLGFFNFVRIDLKYLTDFYIGHELDFRKRAEQAHIEFREKQNAKPDAEQKNYCARDGGKGEGVTTYIYEIDNPHEIRICSWPSKTYIEMEIKSYYVRNLIQYWSESCFGKLNYMLLKTFRKYGATLASTRLTEDFLQHLDSLSELERFYSILNQNPFDLKQKQKQEKVLATKEFQNLNKSFKKGFIPLFSSLKLEKNQNLKHDIYSIFLGLYFLFMKEKLKKNCSELKSFCLSVNEFSHPATFLSDSTNFLSLHFSFSELFEILGWENRSENIKRVKNAFSYLYELSIEDFEQDFSAYTFSKKRLLPEISISVGFRNKIECVIVFHRLLFQGILTNTNFVPITLVEEFYWHLKKNPIKTKYPFYLYNLLVTICRDIWSGLSFFCLTTYPIYSKSLSNKQIFHYYLFSIFCFLIKKECISEFQVNESIFSLKKLNFSLFHKELIAMRKERKVSYKILEKKAFIFSPKKLQKNSLSFNKQKNKKS